MKSNSVEIILSEAVAAITPDNFDAVLSACDKRGEVIHMDQYTKNTVETDAPAKKPWVKQLVATAAAVALIIGCTLGFGSYQKANAVQSVVSVDAGSAVSLNVNRDNVVIGISENALGIEKSDVKGKTVAEATRDITVKMAEAGEITAEDSIVLLSVEDMRDIDETETAPEAGGEDAASPDKKVSGTIDMETALEIAGVIKDALAGLGIDATVIDQKLASNETLHELSEKLGITAGKTSFIEKILDTTSDENTGAEDLAGLSISAIIKYAASFISESGLGSDSSVIDTDQIGTAIKGALNEGINVDIPDKAKIGVQAGEDGSFSANVETDAVGIDVSGNQEGDFALGVTVDGQEYSFDSTDPLNSMIGLIGSIMTAVK